MKPKWSEEIRKVGNMVSKYSCYTLVLYLADYGKQQFYYKPVDDLRADGGFLRKGLYVFKISMQDYMVNERDMRFALRQFEEFIEIAKTEGAPTLSSKRAYKFGDLDNKNIERLKTKTLLISKSLLSISEEQVYDLYPFDMEIVATDDDVDEILESDEEGKYAYYDIVWSDKRRIWGLFLIDNKSGDIITEKSIKDTKHGISLTVGEKHLANLAKLLGEK